MLLPPELSPPLLVLLLCEGRSRLNPNASPPLPLLSRALPALSALACAELSMSWVSTLVAVTLPIPARHKITPSSQCLVRMAMLFPSRWQGLDRLRKAGSMPVLRRSAARQRQPVRIRRC